LIPAATPEAIENEILAVRGKRRGLYKVYFRDIEIGECDAEALGFRPVQFVR
jgi:hypothetical protein